MKISPSFAAVLIAANVVQGTGAAALSGEKHLSSGKHVALGEVFEPRNWGGELSANFAFKAGSKAGKYANTWMTFAGMSCSNLQDMGYEGSVSYLRKELDKSAFVPMDATSGEIDQDIRAAIKAMVIECVSQPA